MTTKILDIRHRSRSSVVDLFPQNRRLSDQADSQLRQLRRDVRQLRRKELVERYPAEFNCFRGMQGRARSGLAVIHPRLRRFQDFLLAVGPCPAPGWTIDRINPHDPEYAPTKVQWASKTAQANNRRNTIMLRGEDGRLRPLPEWARIKHQKPDTLRKRYERGWTDVEIITGKRLDSAAGDAAFDRRRSGNWHPLFTKEADWEKAWKEWTSLPENKGMTRADFMVLILANEYEYRSSKLARRFPDEFGENANPDYAPAAPLTDDSEYRWSMRVAHAQREILATGAAMPRRSLMRQGERQIRSAEAACRFVADRREERRYPA